MRWPRNRVFFSSWSNLGSLFVFFLCVCVVSHRRKRGEKSQVKGTELAQWFTMWTKTERGEISLSLSLTHTQINPTEHGQNFLLVFLPAFLLPGSIYAASEEHRCINDPTGRVDKSWRGIFADRNNCNKYCTEHSVPKSTPNLRCKYSHFLKKTSVIFPLQFFCFVFRDAERFKYGAIVLSRGSWALPQRKHSRETI